MMLAAFGILFDYLMERGLRKSWAAVIALIAAINPISMAQFTTFYNDACLMLSLFIVITSLTGLYFDNNKKHYIVLFCALVICTNTKFTGFGYAMMFCLSYAVLLIVSAQKEWQKTA